MDRPPPSPGTSTEPRVSGQLPLSPSWLTTASAASQPQGFDIQQYLNTAQSVFADDIANPPEASTSRRASTSSISISPGALSNGRIIQRRGSGRSNSSRASSVDDQDVKVAEGQSLARLSPLDGLPMDSTLSRSGHHRNVSRDIAARGMGLHSRDNSTNSPILVYDPHFRQKPSSRPHSLGGWSRISLGDADSIDIGYRPQEDHDFDAYAVEDDDRIHLNAQDGPLQGSRSAYGARNNLLSRHDTSGRDLEGSPAEGPLNFTGNVFDGRNRAQGTESYYRNVPADAPTRRRTLVSNIQNELRKMSIRVVNVHQREEGRHTRLADEPDEPPDPSFKPEHAGHVGMNGGFARGTDTRSSDHAGTSQILHRGLRGKSLGIFGPTSNIRLAALAWLQWRWTEPIILVLIIANVLILTIQSSKSVFKHPRPTTRGYFHTWEDTALFAIFICFTLEIILKIIVSGFIFNAEETLQTRSFRERVERLRSRLDGKAVHAPIMNRGDSGSHSQQEWQASDKSNGHSQYHPMPRRPNASSSPHRGGSLATAHLPLSMTNTDSAVHHSPTYPPGPSGSDSDVTAEHNWTSGEGTKSNPTKSTGRLAHSHQDVPFIQAIYAQRAQNLDGNHRKAFMRHSWDRLDFVAVCAFWLTFVLSITGAENRENLYIFRALAALRVARLLTVTSGTTTILRSLKQSAPLLVSVAFFVIFAMMLFSIVGVYAFKGSYQRSCVWIDPQGRNNITLGQHCGGHIEPSILDEVPYIGALSDAHPKGFICPLGQLCMLGENPYNGTQSFDNIFAALLQVVVITGANTWVDIMYAMIDAEYFVSCFFFIVCLVLLNFWLMNIFVAVILNTFGNITAETKSSAFAGRADTSILATAGPDVPDKASRGHRRGTRLLKFANWAWVAVIVADVGIQASKSAGDSADRIRWLNRAEFYFTMAFLAEIVMRFFLFLPDYREFFKHTANIVDSVLAVITTVIQLPGIRNTQVYPWLTVFQLMRFYRVILAVPRMRKLLSKVLSSVTGLVNMILFLLVMNFVAAVIAVQFLRGGIPEEVDSDFVQYSFYQMYNAFLAIYVVFSSENWTDILYAATSAEATSGRAWISAIFISGWFLLANFILLQMFIAVINEGFAIAEEEKQKAQMAAFVKQAQLGVPTISWISRLNPYRFVKARPKVVSVDTLPANLVLPLGKTTVRNYMGDPSVDRGAIPELYTSPQDSGSFASALKRAAGRLDKSHLDGDRNETSKERWDQWDVDRQLDLLNFQDGIRSHNNEGRDAERERRALQADFITSHPTYDKSLWIFSNSNPIRRICQRLVDPPHGDRIFGVAPHRTWTALFKLLILCAIAGSVTIAATANPAYRRDFYLENGHLRLTWFNLTEVSLGFIFVVEFLIKITADGFVFTPNAYLLSVWCVLEFIVLCTLVVNIGTALSPSNAGTSRFTRSLKAFRALRLINLSATMRQTFYDVMIVGASLIFDAAVLTILYIIPYSIWGQNLFSGLLLSCNDGDVLGKTQCIGEYTATPLEWGILVPRAWQNPYVWSFDSFRSAFLILFEIVSLEGWVDVMDSAMAVVGTNLQPQDNYSQYNSIFFLIYNLIGAIVVLTLFVSVIIENFTVKSGQAFLTSEQQQWLDLKKLIVRQRPSQRPQDKPDAGYRLWCYDRSVQKHGWWSRMMTGLYVIHIGVLASQTYSQNALADNARDYVFLALTLVYAFDIHARMVGLGLASFLKNGWNVYDCLVVTGTFATTIPLLLNETSQAATQLQKLFLVCISFKLVQKNNSLNQLFKTATASLPAIMNVFGLWLTLFLVWAIFFLETFSLTRWQNNETYTQNYSTFSKAMVMLTLMSTGEGWNAFMHDYTVQYPHCSPSDSYLFTDCGDAAGAFVLFITWNIISMYILTNILTGIVVGNFSYVFSLHGRTTSLGREEMRAFKEVWAKFDSGRTGYLQRKHFVAFFSNLTGVFDVKLYDDEHRIAALCSACMTATGKPGRDSTDGINLECLEQKLAGIDFHEVAKRKKAFNRLYHEATLSETPGKGVSFTSMLMMLAHHKLIEPGKALKIEDLLQRKAKESRVDDLVSLDRVRGLLQTVYWRRKFQEHKRSRMQIDAPLPTIVLEDDGENRTADSARPSLFLDPHALPASPTLSGRTSTSTPPPADLLSPRGSTFGDHSDDGSQNFTPRHSQEEGRRPSMGDDFAKTLADNDWSKMLEEELAHSESK